MLVVSNRGPYRFVAEADGDVHRPARRGRAGQRAATAARRTATTTPPGSRPHSPTATAAAARPARTAVPGLDLVLLDLDPALARLHYDVVSNGVLWFLHHGMFDLVRRPRFDHRFHDAWAGYVEVNARFAAAVAETAAEGDVVLGAGLPTRVRPPH